MENYICIEGMKTEISCETAENLKKQFGKEPELRHGDYGEDSQGISLLIARPDYGKDLLSFDKHADHCGRIVNGQHGTRDFTLLGNIFDDLARNAEDLEKLDELVCGGGILKAVILGDSIQFSIGRDTATATLSEAQEIHQKLGQVIATALRRKRSPRTVSNS